jgi:hypothetical protein
MTTIESEGDSTAAAAGGGLHGKSRRLGQAEIVDINTDTRPLALRIALLVPLTAGLLGLANSFRMARLTDTARTPVGVPVLG